MYKQLLLLLFFFFFFNNSSWSENDINNLIKALKNKEPSVRLKAINEMKGLLETSKLSIPELISKFGVTNDEIQSVYLVLKQIGKESPFIIVPNLINAFTDKDSHLEYRASLLREILTSIGRELPSEVISTLINALSNKDVFIRGELAIVLGEIGEKASPAVPALVKLFYTDKESYQYKQLILGSREDIPIPTISISYSAAEALAKIGKQGIPHLIKALSDENPEIRSIAAFALGAIGEKAESAIPALIKALSDKDSKVRAGVLYAFEKMGEKAVPAAPAVIEAILDKNEYVGIHPCDVLRKMGEKAIPHLIKGLSHPEVQVVVDVSAILREIGDKAILPLINALTNEIPLKYAVMETLKGIGGKSSIPLFIQALSDQDSQKECAIVWALGEFKDVSVLPNLIHVLLDKEEVVSNSAKEAIEKIGKAGLDDLKKALQDKTLSEIHPKIKEIIEKIEMQGKKN